MDKLEGYLKYINEKLEQIYAITQNQATVLLESMNDQQTINVLEEMFGYKDQLMKELVEVELEFQEAYYKKRDELQQEGRLGKIKLMIEKIFKIKDKIMAAEQKNILLMQSRTPALEKVEIQIQPMKVVESYKKYSGINKS